MSKGDLNQKLAWLMESSKADYTIVSVYRSARKVLRFSDFRVKQALSDDTILVYLKVIDDHRAGVAVAGSLEREELNAALEHAMRIAGASKPEGHITPPLRRDQVARHTPAHYPRTAGFSIDNMFSRIKDIFDRARQRNTGMAGAFIISSSEELIIDSDGFDAYQPSTVSSIKLISSAGDGSAHSCKVTRNIDDIDFARLADDCIERSLSARSPRRVEPGLYDCILLPEAVGELVFWLAYIGFGAGSIYDGTSFLKGRIGKRIMHKKFTIYDDGGDKNTLSTNFDCEGVFKKKTYLIREGTAEGPVYDTYYGNIFGKESTGHAVPPEASEGPLPLNLIIEAGGASVEDMIKEVKRGLLVSRFHYVNGLLDTREALMTGLTRDGVFFVEDGKIRYPVKDLRFTQGIVEAFSRIDAVSGERSLVADPSGDSISVFTPSILVRDIRFTSRAG